MVSSLTDQDEEATGEEQVANSPRERRLELVVTVLLGLSALLTAWCAYESSRFSGEQTTLTTQASALQVESTRADNRAGQLGLVDVTSFQQWSNAALAGDTVRADAYRRRFRKEFSPAFEAWVALDPFNDPGAPRTPFEMPQYKPAAAVQAQELLALAKDTAAQGDDQGGIADNYVLTVVLFAAALFLLGIQTRIGIFELRLALVSIAGLLVVGTTIWVLVLPKLWPW
jgi:hypothetical protein